MVSLVWLATICRKESNCGTRTAISSWNARKLGLRNISQCARPAEVWTLHVNSSRKGRMKSRGLFSASMGTIEAAEVRSSYVIRRTRSLYRPNVFQSLCPGAFTWLRSNQFSTHETLEFNLLQDPSSACEPFASSQGTAPLAERKSPILAKGHSTRAHRMHGRSLPS